MTTTIILTEEDAELFKKFMENYDSFEKIYQSGVFEIGYGKGVLNFAGNILQNIIIEEIKYKR